MVRLFLDPMKVRVKLPTETNTNTFFFFFFWVEYKTHMQLYHETTWSQALKVYPPPFPPVKVSDPPFSSTVR